MTQIRLLKQGIVRHIDRFDISLIYIENCRRTLIKQKLEG
jgi:hypothetical protein